MSNLEHHLNVEVAMKYGDRGALILHNIAFWVRDNKANNRNFFEGRYWTFNSRKAFAEIFPYYTEMQIKQALKNLIKSGALLVGNFNDSPYNHTNWYTLSDELLKIYDI